MCWVNFSFKGSYHWRKSGCKLRTCVRHLPLFIRAFISETFCERVVIDLQLCDLQEEKLKSVKISVTWVDLVS